jgi:hypothetical protein
MARHCTGLQLTAACLAFQEWIVVSLVYDPKVLICPDADLIQELNMTIVFPGKDTICYGVCGPSGPVSFMFVKSASRLAWI